MRVVPLQEMQHVGEFVAAVRDLGAGLRLRTQPLPQARLQPGEFGKPTPALLPRQLDRQRPQLAVALDLKRLGARLPQDQGRELLG